jgi:hypothetical protein
MAKAMLHAVHSTEERPGHERAIAVIHVVAAHDETEGRPIDPPDETVGDQTIVLLIEQEIAPPRLFGLDGLDLEDGARPDRPFHAPARGAETDAVAPAQEFDHEG